MDKFVIIDGNSLVNRAFYALPPLSASDGKIYNAVFGFTNILAKLIMEYKPKYLCVAFDAGRKNFRHQLYAEYKGTRKGMPEELAGQMPVLKDLLNKMGICILEQVGIEADDIIGTMVRRFDNVQNIIVTGDRDCLQLINHNTEVWLTKKGITDIVTVNERQLLEEFGLRPSQVIDLKALMGDASDNIPGVAGIGEKTAMSLLEKYDNITNLLQKLPEIDGKLGQKLRDGVDICKLSYALATINTNCDIDCSLEQCIYPFPWSKTVLQLCNQYEFRSLIRRTDLFTDGVQMANMIPSNNIQIGLYDIADLVTKNSGKDEFAIYWDNNEVHFAWDKVSNYCVQLLATTLPIVMNELKECFGDKYKVYSYNLKALYYALDEAKIALPSNPLDVSLAMYLVNSNVREDSPRLLLEYLGLNQTTLATGLLQAKEYVFNELNKLNLTNLYQDIELPLVRVLYIMECNGIRVNQEALNQLAPKYQTEIAQITDKIYKICGKEFNINSPKQLSVILFDELKLSMRNNKKKSTAVEVLENLKGEHPLINELLRYRKVTKLYSTYIEGMRNYIKKDGKIHTIFNQTTAVTGRLSSNEPNLQNIPVRSDEGRELRKLFVASEGCKLLSADYSQIELRLLAHYSGDAVLCNAYAEGKDIHTITASQIFDVALDQVTSEMRRDAKAVNFGIIYGISPYGLAKNIGSTPAKAKAYIDKYFETYPTIKAFLDGSIESVKKQGFVSSLFGRIRKINVNTESYTDNKFGERAAMNMPLQGTASDIIKIAMLRVQEQLEKRKLKSKLILQIHDELILDVPNNELEEVTSMVRERMEGVVSLRVPLIVDIETGDDWYQC